MQKSISQSRIENRIYHFRGHKVMLDSDLADLYEVPTKQLNLAVRRNKTRFPADFMFQLTSEEFQRMRLQTETSKNEGRGGRRYLPYVFTEHGVTMLASVLNSDRAIEVNVAIVRAFVRLRELSESHRDLAEKLGELERKYDNRFRAVFAAIRHLMAVGSPAVQRRIKGRNEKE